MIIVENFITITKIENGKMKMNGKTTLMSGAGKIISSQTFINLKKLMRGYLQYD